MLLRFLLILRNLNILIWSLVANFEKWTFGMLDNLLLLLQYSTLEKWRDRLLAIPAVRSSGTRSVVQADVPSGCLDLFHLGGT